MTTSPFAARHRRRPDPWVRPRRLMLVIAAAITGGVVGFLVLYPGARLVLTTAEVAVGESYDATFSGFAPGEDVRLSWTGPTDGEMGIFPADLHGGCRHGPIVEVDPPGDYTIIATGLGSGRSATAPVRVVAARRAELSGAVPGDR